MNIYRYSFPIENYEGTDTFEFHVYFSSERCPKRSEIVKRLQELRDDEKNAAEKHDFLSLQEYDQCLRLMDGAELPFLGFGCVGSNTFVDTRFGRRSLSVRCLQINDLTTEFKSLYGEP